MDQEISILQTSKDNNNCEWWHVQATKIRFCSVHFIRNITFRIIIDLVCFFFFFLLLFFVLLNIGSSFPLLFFVNSDGGRRVYFLVHSSWEWKRYLSFVLCVRLADIQADTRGFLQFYFLPPMITLSRFIQNHLDLEWCRMWAKTLFFFSFLLLWFRMIWNFLCNFTLSLFIAQKNRSKECAGICTFNSSTIRKLFFRNFLLKLHSLWGSKLTQSYHW